MAYKRPYRLYLHYRLADRRNNVVEGNIWSMTSREVQIVDLQKVKVFLKQYVEILKKSGKSGDGYAVDTVEDLLTRL